VKFVKVDEMLEVASKPDPEETTDGS
jgi:hypothetical protein